jgi:anthranilate synthase component 1
MHISPSLQEVKRLAADGQYKVVPVSCEMLADVCTPMEALKKLKNISTH